jgi:asparagine synthase (glutamine-hydrolysing)
MCGIAGVVGPNATEDQLLGMLELIHHRGEPAYHDERFVSQGFAMGTNRLAIVGEDNGRQPFVSEDGRFVCVVNGEIYNHDELRAQLSGDRTRGSCDAEIVLAGYREWGLGVLDRLRGMFGFALYDSHTNRVLLARDPMGIKPLYFSQVGAELYFASELKGIARLAGVTRVEELGPGHYWTDGAQRRYWRLPGFASDGEIRSDELFETLSGAVSCHLPVGHDRVACLLSGGVDSSTVLALAARLHRGEVEAWTFSSGAADSGDLAAAKVVTGFLGVPLRIVQPEQHELQKLYLSSGVWLTETWEPALVRNAVSYHVLCRAVSAAGYKYCLSGEGADELFGGYDYFARCPDAGRDAAVRSSLAEIHRTYLQMADRAAMFATLEVRVPYMDKEVVAAAAALPRHGRFHRGIGKYALRELHPELLPASIRLRPKAGMNAGAGFGSNDPGTGIYHEVVCDHYQHQSRDWSTDRAVAERHRAVCGVDIDNPEEVYNFARYVEYGFHRLASERPRPQLNVTALRGDVPSESDPNPLTGGVIDG